MTTQFIEGIIFAHINKPTHITWGLENMYPVANISKYEIVNLKNLMNIHETLMLLEQRDDEPVTIMKGDTLVINPMIPANKYSDEKVNTLF